MSVVVLNDKKIRDSLSVYLGRRRPKPCNVLHELHFHNGNAIADIVTVHKFMHAYEIKGQTDNVSRVIKQADFYNVSFPRLTLVTTENHISWAMENLPIFWGILLVLNTADGPRFFHKRPAKQNPYFCKKKALLMLWKEELVNAALVSNILTRKSDSRFDLAEKLDKALRKSEVASLVSNVVNRRVLQAIHNKGNV